MRDVFLKQINKFYDGELRSDLVIYLGNTPENIVPLGAEKLPLIMKQSTLRKCIREPRGSRSAHKLNRELIEKIPEMLQNPIIVLRERERNSLALICDFYDWDGHHILLVVQMGQMVYGTKVNEIKSIYGKNNLKTYIDKHEPKDIYIIDKKKVSDIIS